MLECLHFLSNQSYLKRPTLSQISLIKNAKNHFLLVKKLKNTESAQLWYWVRGTCYWDWVLGREGHTYLIESLYSGNKICLIWLILSLYFCLSGKWFIYLLVFANPTLWVFMGAQFYIAKQTWMYSKLEQENNWAVQATYRVGNYSLKSGECRQYIGQFIRK